ncbi:hypothetical protein HSB1_30550 [Halogranum salarium B-1]|uniref:Uncharacterized protein n=1 Tax=Halogranum salarium B-1 TaxID=1210908 RepID=J3EVE3_9EURY|nr:hypothetical protein HSB1_30550 [Halogranum salarium B-1]
MERTTQKRPVCETTARTNRVRGSVEFEGVPICTASSRQLGRGDPKRVPSTVP